MDLTNKIDFIKNLFVDNPKYNILDQAMDANNIEITTTDKSITLILNNNALKQDIMHYLDDPDYTPEGFEVLTTGDKDGKYRMDAEIDLSNFTDIANNPVGNTLDGFKIEFNVTVTEGTPDYNSDVIATFIEQ